MFAAVLYTYSMSDRKAKELASMTNGMSAAVPAKGPPVASAGAPVDTAAAKESAEKPVKPAPKDQDGDAKKKDSTAEKPTGESAKPKAAPKPDAVDGDKKEQEKPPKAAVAAVKPSAKDADGDSEMKPTAADSTAANKKKNAKAAGEKPAPKGSTDAEETEDEAETGTAAAAAAEPEPDREPDTGADADDAGEGGEVEELQHRRSAIAVVEADENGETDKKASKPKPGATKAVAVASKPKHPLVSHADRHLKSGVKVIYSSNIRVVPEVDLHEISKEIFPFKGTRLYIINEKVYIRLSAVLNPSSKSMHSKQASVVAGLVLGIDYVELDENAIADMDEVKSFVSGYTVDLLVADAGTPMEEDTPSDWYPRNHFYENRKVGENLYLDIGVLFSRMAMNMVWVAYKDLVNCPFGTTTLTAMGFTEYGRTKTTKLRTFFGQIETLLMQSRLTLAMWRIAQEEQAAAAPRNALTLGIALSVQIQRLYTQMMSAAADKRAAAAAAAASEEASKGGIGDDADVEEDVEMKVAGEEDGDDDTDADASKKKKAAKKPAPPAAKPKPKPVPKRKAPDAEADGAAEGDDGEKPVKKKPAKKPKAEASDRADEDADGDAKMQASDHDGEDNNKAKPKPKPKAPSAAAAPKAKSSTPAAASGAKAKDKLDPKALMAQMAAIANGDKGITDSITAPPKKKGKGPIKPGDNDE